MKRFLSILMTLSVLSPVEAMKIKTIEKNESNNNLKKSETVVTPQILESKFEEKKLEVQTPTPKSIFDTKEWYEDYKKLDPHGYAAIDEIKENGNRKIAFFPYFRKSGIDFLSEALKLNNTLEEFHIPLLYFSGETALKFVDVINNLEKVHTLTIYEKIAYQNEIDHPDRVGATKFVEAILDNSNITTLNFSGLMKIPYKNKYKEDEPYIRNNGDVGQTFNAATLTKDLVLKTIKRNEKYNKREIKINELKSFSVTNDLSEMKEYVYYTNEKWPLINLDSEVVFLSPKIMNVHIILNKLDLRKLQNTDNSLENQDLGSELLEVKE